MFSSTERYLIDLERRLNFLERQVKLLETIEVDMTLQGCRVYNSGAFSHTSSGGWLDVTFDSERFDPDGRHSPISFTARINGVVAGKYLIIGQLEFAANATGVRMARIFLNNTTAIASASVNNMGAAITTRLEVMTIYDLAASDYVTLSAYQNSGGTLSIAASGNYSPEFMAWRLA